MSLYAESESRFEVLRKTGLKEPLRPIRVPAVRFRLVRLQDERKKITPVIWKGVRGKSPRRVFAYFCRDAKVGPGSGAGSARAAE